MAAGQSPKVFISYSWEDDSHRKWVREFATRLRKDGIDAILDQWKLVPGDQLPGFLAQSIRESDFVLCICTPQYKKRSDQRSGGAGYEGDIITAEVFANHNPRKFIPVLRRGEWKQSAPSWLLGKFYFELRGNPYGEADYQGLVTALWSRRESSPLINSPPLWLPGLAIPPGDATPEAPPEDKKGVKSTASKPTSRAKPPAEKPPEKIGDKPSDEVSFTAFHPREGKVDTWHTVLVYAHLLSAAEPVHRDVKRFKDELPAPKETSSASSTRIVRGTAITIIPVCEGITFNPERISLKWMEDFHRAEFRFKADSSFAGDAAKGHISIYVGPLIIGTLKFAMLFTDKDLPSAADHEEQANMYRKDEIFISYSHKDTDIAFIFRNVLEATGYDVLIDVDDLRAGQVWNEQLMRMIERADIFQLFWSSNSCQSEYCRQEWEHALKQNKGEGYIRPVYWQKPLSPPPQELSKFHFDYIELKIPTALGD